LCTFKQGHEKSGAEEDIVFGAAAHGGGGMVPVAGDADLDSAGIDVGRHAQVKYGDH